MPQKSAVVITIAHGKMNQFKFNQLNFFKCRMRHDFALYFFLRFIGDISNNESMNSRER